jgi:Domain of unknown function (DUF3786)
MSIQDAQRAVVGHAASELMQVDVGSRCRMLGLPLPQGNLLRFRAFGLDLLLTLPSFDLVLAEGGKPAKLGDQILVLHYLQCNRPIAPTGELIRFRDLPGGRFYWQPFLSRSIEPLTRRIGNDLGLLTRHLSRYDWKPFEAGELGARIHVIGMLDATLVYHCGDEEFGPAAEILFDACVKRVLTTEEVAHLASRICLGLL